MQIGLDQCRSSWRQRDSASQLHEVACTQASAWFNQSNRLTGTTPVPRNPRWEGVLFIRKALTKTSQGSTEDTHPFACQTRLQTSTGRKGYCGTAKMDEVADDMGYYFSLPGRRFNHHSIGAASIVAKGGLEPNVYQLKKEQRGIKAT